MRTIFSEQTQQKSLMQKGYVKMPMLSNDEVSYILNQLQNLRPNDNFTPKGAGHFQFTYHCTFLDTNRDYKRKANALMRQVFEPHVKKTLINYEILNANFYVKPPGSGEFHIHQNWPAISDRNDTTLTIWCALVDTDKQNGTIEVVEGSHKIVPDIAGPNVTPFFKKFQTALIEKYLKPIPMEAGGCLIFDDSLIHWSSQNDSARPRLAIQMLCVPKDTRPVYYHFDPGTPDRFELFEVDSEYFIEHTITELSQIATHCKSLGFIKNPNRILTEAEFAEKLQNGETIRKMIYFPESQ